MPPLENLISTNPRQNPERVDLGEYSPANVESHSAAVVRQATTRNASFEQITRGLELLKLEEPHYESCANYLLNLLANPIELRNLKNLDLSSFFKTGKLPLQYKDMRLPDALLGICAHLPKLEHLNITNCGISTLPESLHGHPNLKDIIASNNRLKDLDENLLFSIPQLKYLDLSNNKLKQVSRDLFALLISIRHGTLHLQNNPLDKDSLDEAVFHVENMLIDIANFNPHQNVHGRSSLIADFQTPQQSPVLAKTPEAMLSEQRTLAVNCKKMMGFFETHPQFIQHLDQEIVRKQNGMAEVDIKILKLLIIIEHNFDPDLEKPLNLSPADKVTVCADLALEISKLIDPLSDVPEHATRA